MAKADLGEQEKSLESLQKQLGTLLIPKTQKTKKMSSSKSELEQGGDEGEASCRRSIKNVFPICREVSDGKQKLSVPMKEVQEVSEEIVMRIDGENVFGILKFESGVHRVQRVPKTESPRDAYIPQQPLLPSFPK